MADLHGTISDWYGARRWNVHDGDQPGLVVRGTSAPDVGPVVVARERGVCPVEDGGPFDGDDICSTVISSPHDV
jgi:hypothetical protein